MRSITAGLFGVACLGLTGCATQPASPPPAIPTAQIVETVKSGRAILDCRDACLASWRQVQPRAAQLDAAAQWTDLAVLVMRTGFQDDLSLYYLGRAAEGLGAPAAARRYYAESMQLSATARSCRSFSTLCGGLPFPQAASLRLAAIDRTVAGPPAPRRSPRPLSRQPIPLEPGTAIPLDTGAPPPIDFPATASTQALPPPSPPMPPHSPPIAAEPAPAAAPLPRGPQPSADFIEPPPAPR